MSEAQARVQAKQLVRESRDRAVLLEAYSALEKTGLQEKDSKKLAAEISFLIAESYLHDGDSAKASEYGENSAKLYKQMGAGTMADVTPILNEFLPEVMHEGVVSQRILHR